MWVLRPIELTMVGALQRNWVDFNDQIEDNATRKVAQRRLIKKRFPKVPIIGIFVARNIKVQDDSKSNFKPEGREFESLRARKIPNTINQL